MILSQGSAEITLCVGGWCGGMCVCAPVCVCTCELFPTEIMLAAIWFFLCLLSLNDSRERAVQINQITRGRVGAGQSSAVKTCHLSAKVALLPPMFLTSSEPASFLLPKTKQPIENFVGCDMTPNHLLRCAWGTVQHILRCL